MEGHVTWDLSNYSIASKQELENDKKCKIIPNYPSAEGKLTVYATINFGAFNKTYSTTIQIGTVSSSQITISGEQLVCPGDVVGYYTNSISGVDDYDWDWYGFNYYYGQGTDEIVLQVPNEPS